MLTRHIEGDRHPADGAVDPHAGKVHAPRIRHHILGVDIAVRAEAVGNGLTRHPRHDFAHMRVIGTEHGHAVERQAVEKIDESPFQTLEIMAVGFHVIGVDIGHHRNHRRQEKEGRIRLIGFRHQKIARTELGIGASRVQPTTDDEGRIDATFGQHAGNEAGGGGLAMGTGNGDALFQAHQLGQHEGTRHDRNALFPGGHDLRVVFLDGSRSHYRIGTGDVFRRVANGHAHPSPSRRRVVALACRSEPLTV